MRRLQWLGLLIFVGLMPCLASARAGTSNSLMDIHPDGRLLLVANPDNGTVTVVDTIAHRAIREIAIGEKPEGVAWIGHGTLAAATAYHDDKVIFFDAATGHIHKKLAVAAEPYGIVANKSGTHAWVTQEYPGVVSEIDMKTFTVCRVIPVASFIRGIALSPDETQLYVTQFYTAALHQVDLATGKVVDKWPGNSTDNLCRSVVIHPQRPKAYLTHVQSRVHVAQGNGSIFPQLSICDLKPADGSRRRKNMALDTYNGVRVVTNPWESAISPDGHFLYTIYAATNDMNVSRVLDDDYREIERYEDPTIVGKNPRAIRVSPDGAKIYIYNALDFQVGIYQAPEMKRVAKITVCKPPKTPEWVQGKILFNTALPPLTSRLWIACSSCHPDGHTDGRVWQNPEGLRKTTAFFGLAHTHPLHWSADRDEVQDFEYTIRGKLMQGAGLMSGTLKPKQDFHPTELDEPLAGRSKDLDALAIYCNSFAYPLSPHIPGPGKLSEAAKRGQRLFVRADVACASCHSGPYYTDSCLAKPFRLHDVGTGQDDPTEKIGPNYDTPTLLGVYRTAPYLHHGKALTLRDVLTTWNRQDKHGKTSHLKPADIDDLVEFLKSLPYESPPLETPNTVRYRVVVPAKH